MPRMRFFTFRCSDGDEIREMHDADNPPDVVWGQGGAALYSRVDDDYIVNPKLASDRPLKQTVDGFVSRTLPRNWRHHTGKFLDRDIPGVGMKGACVFRSKAEAKEACRRGEGEGECPMEYDY